MRVAHLLAARYAAESQRGQGLTEYALMLAFVAIVAIAALTMLGADLAGTLAYIGETIGDSQP